MLLVLTLYTWSSSCCTISCDTSAMSWSHDINKRHGRPEWWSAHLFKPLRKLHVVLKLSFDELLHRDTLWSQGHHVWLWVFKFKTSADLQCSNQERYKYDYHKITLSTFLRLNTPCKSLKFSMNSYSCFASNLIFLTAMIPNNRKTRIEIIWQIEHGFETMRREKHITRP